MKAVTKYALFNQVRLFGKGLTVYHGARRQVWEARQTMKKDELIREMRKTRAEVMTIVERLSTEALTTQQNADGWTVKDILSHLARWEGELVTLLWQLSQGQKLDCVLVRDPMPVDELNHTWQVADRDRPLARVLDDLQAVRRQTEKRLAEVADQDLEREDLAPEFRGIALWHRVAANTFEHDSEHLDDLRAREAA